VTNLLGYNTSVVITAVKKFIEQIPGANFVMSLSQKTRSLYNKKLQTCNVPKIVKIIRKLVF
jgi:hypothetical protein